MENITPLGMPARRALAVLDNPPPESAGPALRVTKKVRAAIDLLVSGECKKIRDAAEKVGLAPETLSRAFAKPHVTALMIQKVQRSLALAAARAGAVKEELLDSDNAIVRDRASSFVLGLAGIAPASTPSVSLNLEIKAGYIIDISPDPSEVVDLRPARAISRD
jgi:hypothetical protein